MNDGLPVLTQKPMLIDGKDLVAYLRDHADDSQGAPSEKTIKRRKLLRAAVKAGIEHKEPS